MTGDVESDDSLAALYRQAVLTHAAAPHGQGVAIEATHEAEGHNPLCGDRVVIRLQILPADGLVKAAAFDGEACAICLASASLLCQHLPGKAQGDLEAMIDGFSAALVNGDHVIEKCPAFLQPMLGVRAYPARIACATLPWRTAIDAITP
ncbi:SUF system NifU family Fe-S cluster assembly protein [Marinihelvus fidelis]|uniref:SUF system NifU family Fe-S cluster assembly protein n=1 Tax=Marinihelvus fidelis TaxID=2613842 RepID=A0A5N0TDI1_9GAMM|nr:SUF system NifU family Fe-S cluster assembly protein [Marinihelvus fidelis]KAA9133082.1 SUF system NifU family Fe-S cluster assembly protein [Marinihelvus fidelis]